MNRRQFLRRRPGTFVTRLNRPIEHMEFDQATSTILCLTDQGVHRIELPEVQE